MFCIARLKTIETKRGARERGGPWEKEGKEDREEGIRRGNFRRKKKRKVDIYVQLPPPLVNDIICEERRQ